MTLHCGFDNQLHSTGKLHHIPLRGSCTEVPHSIGRLLHSLKVVAQPRELHHKCVICKTFDLRCESVICIYVYVLICCNTATKGLSDICTTPEGAWRPRESADISVKPRVRPCYNIYVTFSGKSIVTL